ncbi:protein cmss1 [Phtheirospermum japonicum]|uniref:Protein cmss1 n=1 Tax=Phtheirospermum japonicum TaxID=374723 RepID=A0A830B5T8_9LAMI|nr:protein cmss1 [Phtheirospermum japonicum]
MGAATATSKRQNRPPRTNPISKTTKTIDKKKKSSNNKIKDSGKKKKTENEIAIGESKNDVVICPTASQQLSFFLNQYQSANSFQLSSLELDSLKEFKVDTIIKLAETCMVDLCRGPAQNITGKLDEHVKVSYGSSWKEVLCGKRLQEEQVEPGSPALLVISSSAIRSLELLRELRSLTKECHAAKLFSKHMKIEEQVSFLKNRVNIASGTPSRIKKLIDMEALGLTRLALIVLDMYTDVKGYSLFTLPQVRDEFWDLYKSYFHQTLVKGNVRLCLYGPVPTNPEAKKRKPKTI